MNVIIYPAVMVATILIVSCSASNKFRASAVEDKPLYAAINELKKHPQNAKAQGDLPLFYDQAVERHEEAVSVYRNSEEPSKWDKIMAELSMLQNIYTAVSATPGAASILKPKNYTRELEETKTAAAEDFYSRGMSFIDREGRENSLMAYQSFLQASRFVPGYKDVTELLNESYDKSVVNIVINPIEENNIPFSTFENWSNDFRYRPEEYQESLARDLSARSSGGNPVRVVTDREAQRQNISPDMVVELHWRNLSAIPSRPYLYNRNVSKEIQTGKDTANKPIYKTVHATLHITQLKYTVRGNLEYAVRDVMKNSNADQSILSEEVFWTDNYATYTGDSRALSTQDWAMINNSRSYFNIPSKGEILDALMRKLYPDLRRRMEISLGL